MYCFNYLKINLNSETKTYCYVHSNDYNVICKYPWFPLYINFSGRLCDLYKNPYKID